MRNMAFFTIESDIAAPTSILVSNHYLTTSNLQLVASFVHDMSAVSYLRPDFRVSHMINYLAERL